MIGGGRRLVRQLIHLNQGEGRAGDVFERIAARPDEGAGKHGLADAEIPPEGQDVSRPGDGRQAAGEGLGRCFIGEVPPDLEIRSIRVPHEPVNPSTGNGRISRSRARPVSRNRREACARAFGGSF